MLCFRPPTFAFCALWHMTIRECDVGLRKMRLVSANIVYLLGRRESLSPSGMIKSRMPLSPQHPATDRDRGRRAYSVWKVVRLILNEFPPGILARAHS